MTALLLTAESPPHTCTITHAHTPCRFEVRKKKKAATCIEEIGGLILDKYTDKVGSYKRAWRVQVSTRQPAGRPHCLACIRHSGTNKSTWPKRKVAKLGAHSPA